MTGGWCRCDRGFYPGSTGGVPWPRAGSRWPPPSSHPVVVTARMAGPRDAPRRGPAGATAVRGPDPGLHASQPCDGARRRGVRCRHLPSGTPTGPVRVPDGRWTPASGTAGRSRAGPGRQRAGGAPRGVLVGALIPAKFVESRPVPGCLPVGPSRGLPGVAGPGRTGRRRGLSPAGGFLPVLTVTGSPAGTAAHELREVLGRTATR